ncbi:hypothetical protein GOODEAATRI_013431, partial [Goodea atripinnis]
STSPGPVPKDRLRLYSMRFCPFAQRTRLVLVAKGISCLDHTPELKKWTEHMLEDPAVKNTMYSMDTYKAFYKSVAEGKPDYDYGL